MLCFVLFYKEERWEEETVFSQRGNCSFWGRWMCVRRATKWKRSMGRGQVYRSLTSRQEEIVPEGGTQICYVNWRCNPLWTWPWRKKGKHQEKLHVNCGIWKMALLLQSWEVYQDRKNGPVRSCWKVGYLKILREVRWEKHGLRNWWLRRSLDSSW